MRDMMAKFGTQVESFRYAFVLPNHADGWEGNACNAASPAAAPSQTRMASAQTHTPDAKPAFRRRAGDKQPTYIEIKPG
jgi:hypothetical protein